MQAKLIICGEGYVGKTTIRERYIGIKFRSNYLQTIGADFTTKNQELKDGSLIKLQIWDLAGQQAFANTRELYYKGTDGALLVYDVTQPHTADKVFEWLDDIKKVLPLPLSMTLVANKIDLRNSVTPSVTTDQGEVIASKLSQLNGETVSFIESSAKTGENIESIFETLAQTVVDFKSGTSKQNEIETQQSFINKTSSLVDLYFFKMTQAGPMCVSQTVENSDQVLLLKMAIFYSTTLGQGDSAHTGLFGPVPIPESKDNEKYNLVQSILFSFEMDDKNHHDPRAKGKNFCFFVITIPEEILFQFNNKNIIIRLFHDEISGLSDVQDINNNFVQNLKIELLKTIYLANNN